MLSYVEHEKSFITPWPGAHTELKGVGKKACMIEQTETDMHTIQKQT